MFGYSPFLHMNKQPHIQAISKMVGLGIVRFIPELVWLELIPTM